MCDKCQGLTRRDVLKTITVAAIGAATTAAAVGGLTGCQPTPAGGMAELPDALLYEDHLKGDGPIKPGPVKIDPKTIVLPPPMPPQKSDFGDIMPRRSWTRLPLELPHGEPIDGIRKITIHHSGDGKPFLGESAADVARHLQVVQQAHLQRGMVDIAYHFAVDRAGRVWQLRWLHYEGQHVRAGKNGVRNNAHNVGIVVLGDFNRQAVTAAASDRLFDLTKLVRDQYAPAGKASDLPIATHGELVDTDCPGRTLLPLITEARRRGLM